MSEIHDSQLAFVAVPFALCYVIIWPIRESSSLLSLRVSYSLTLVREEVPLEALPRRPEAHLAPRIYSNQETNLEMLLLSLTKDRIQPLLLTIILKF